MSRMIEVEECLPEMRRFCLRDDEDVALICDWHIHLVVILLLELYALLIDDWNNSEPGGSSEGSIPFSNQPVADAVDSHDESVVGDPTTHPYLLNHDSDIDDVDNEPVGGPDDDPVDEFEVGQEFADKEAVMLVVKTYSIRRSVEYKILESDRLKYAVQWPSLDRQYHHRLDSKVIADAIFSMVQADPSISIRVLQGSMETHFGYKASYRKV
ncbi:hypothetical protein PIB30_095681 [Stylosanthes scabra]|uniref:Transposase n=1 Tax=Stylosanthes scabra TaxID=79078 RepID=A0ABU6QV53_9FABA|nr:hypothetical protein [Stylosanthes scabra]